MQVHRQEVTAGTWSSALTLASHHSANVLAFTETHLAQDFNPPYVLSSPWKPLFVSSASTSDHSSYRGGLTLLVLDPFLQL